MDERLNQLGERPHGLRDALGFPMSKVAKIIGIDVGKYELIGRRELGITISNLMKIACRYGLSAEKLMFAEQPHLKFSFVVRKRQGVFMERSKVHDHRNLVNGFRKLKTEVFRSAAGIKSSARTTHRSSHAGQDLNYALEGGWVVYMGSKSTIPNESDRIYFDSSMPNGALAIGNQAMKIHTFSVG